MSNETKIIRMSEQPFTLTLKKCKLVVLQGSDKGKQFILDKSSAKIGTKNDNDFLITDETVSRYHFEVLNTKDGYLLKDQGSTNGTFLNGMRVKEAFLQSGALIKFGQTEMKFVPLDEKIEIFPSKKSKFDNIVGSSIEMRKTFGIIEKIAPTDITVVIEGDTGTGKELVAEAIHKFSHRAAKPFVVVDCSAIAETLIESELFGHEKGAFTNAISQRIGAFELAKGGTVFLDEIGELNLDLQPKLLRALESRTVKRVGSDRHIPIDVRVVAATNRNLQAEVAKNNFREDLYFRLAVVQVFLPPLRRRKDDINLILKHFIESYNDRIGGDKKVNTISEAALNVLMNYPWPGNVRELKNVIDRSITFCQGDVLDVKDLPDFLSNPQQAPSSPSAMPQPMMTSSGIPSDLEGDDDLPFKEAKDKLLELWERDYIIKILKKNNLNISKAAKEAQIDRKSIQRILKKYNLTAKDL